MIRAMRTAASGMLAQQTQVDTIANNIANVNTTGFKKNRVNFRSLLYSTMREPGARTTATNTNPTGLQVGSGTEVSSSIKLHLQGDPEATGNQFDLMITGDGFFKIDLGNGDFRYTRDGSFRRDGNGDLVTVDGFKLVPPITLPQEATDMVVALDGTVQVKLPNTDNLQQNGQISVYRFPNPAGLKAQGSNFFSETASSGDEVQQVPGQGGAGFVRQGFLERSNTSVVDELIALIQAQRNYEVNSRTIQVSDEMLQQAAQLI
jgi:flagellar basal-body rod protein FlgG